MATDLHTTTAPLPSLTSALSRRRALFGAAVLAAAPAAAGGALAAPSASVPTDPTFAAIERHRVAVAAFDEALQEGADMVHVPAEIEERHGIASDAEFLARYDMHQDVPTTLAGLAAYVGYWYKFMASSQQLDEIGFEALPTIAEALENLTQAGGQPHA